MKSRRLQLRLWLRGMAVYEQKLRIQVARSRTRYINAVAGGYESNAAIPSHMAGDYKQAVRNALQSHYQEVIPYFGGLVLKNIKSRKIEKKAVENLFASLMAEWITTQALAKAERISSTDTDEIRSVIDAGVTAGESVNTIAANIRKVSQQTPYRAALIARTETHNAATYGSLQTARQAEQEFGVTLQKVWLATNDDRTRQSHIDADGQAVGLDQMFNVDGVYMDRPGDDSAPPDQTINCRCGIAHEEKE